MRKNKKYLLLIRHGLATVDAAGLGDFDRPLSAKGIEHTQNMVKKLKKAKVFPADCVLCSTALRARQTVEILEPYLKGAEIYYKDALYLAPRYRLQEQIENVDFLFKRLFLVGHKEGLNVLLKYLLPISKEEFDIPLSGGVLLSFCEEKQWNPLLSCSAKIEEIFFPAV